jgi:OsmC subfamily peroxiredoxin
MKTNGSAVWQGGIKDGKGAISTRSGAPGLPLRFQQPLRGEARHQPGGADRRGPRRLLHTEQAKGFIDALARSLNLAKNEVWKSKRGKHLAGTWAHWQVALAYAKYLSHEFHHFVNEAFREWAEEQANPDLKVERAAQAYRGMMALSLILGEAGLTAERMETRADVTLDKVGDGYAITAVHLTLKARIPGTDQARFEELAGKAKAGCPVSKLLNTAITLDATLEI